MNCANGGAVIGANVREKITTNGEGLQAKLIYGFYNKDWLQKAWRKKYPTADG